ncbi:MAG: hypothetical protein LBE08_01840 [Bifidobacteriaceae bacterium]|jgi:hypothetical protein|nr:hypothetical protein [Bifidobacteriaceae bacterium]
MTTTWDADLATEPCPEFEAPTKCRECGEPMAAHPCSIEHDCWKEVALWETPEDFDGASCGICGRVWGPTRRGGWGYVCRCGCEHE